MSAVSAQNGGHIKFIPRINFRLVSGAFGVAFKTRKPFAAAFEFDGDNVEFASPMSATRLRVYV